MKNTLVKADLNLFIEHIPMKKGIEKEAVEKSIEKALDFLETSQLSSGEFAFYTSNSPLMTPVYTVPRCPFTATFVLHALKYVGRTKRTEKIINKGLHFLLTEKEPPGIWRMSKASSPMPALDLDDTCLSLAALREYEVTGTDYEFSAKYLEKYRNKEGLFYTWILENFEENNTIDSVVNTNVLFFYSFQNRTFGNVLKHLNDVVKNSELQKNKFESVYYPSPYALTYAVTRLYKDGGIRNLNIPTSLIGELILKKQKSEGLGENDLEVALAAVSLLNIGYRDNQINNALSHLLEAQRPNGSWPNNFIFVGPFLSDPCYYYGSEELTTTFSLEALAKYLYHNYSTK
jgi:squalene cyclase